jgi:hypothetical protein
MPQVTERLPADIQTEYTTKTKMARQHWPNFFGTNITAPEIFHKLWEKKKTGKHITASTTRTFSL